MDVVSIFFLDLGAIMHIVCVYLIRKYLRKKPLGMQTLVDLFMINTLIVQCIDVITCTVLLNLAVFSTHPINKTIAIFLTFVAEIVLTVDICFLLFNVLIKYVCIYHSSIQEMIPDSKVIKTIWMFSIILSLILVITEFQFIHELQTSGIYNCLQHQGPFIYNKSPCRGRGGSENGNFCSLSVSKTCLLGVQKAYMLMCLCNI